MKSIMQTVVILVLVVVLAAYVLFTEQVRIPSLLSQKESEVRAEIDLSQMSKTMVARILPEKSIVKYSEFTEDALANFVEFVEVPTTLVPERPVTSADELVNMVAKEDFEAGEMISLDDISSADALYKDYSRIKEFDFNTNVIGKLRKGVFIDVLVVYENGDYDVVMPKVQVLDVKTNLNETGQKIDVNRGEATVALPLNDEVSTRDMELAKRLGKFEAKIYFDEKQPASQKTFDYAKMLVQKQLADSVISAKNALKENTQSTVTTAPAEVKTETEINNTEVLPEESN